MKSARGFALIEFMFGLAIIFILVLIIFGKRDSVPAAKDTLGNFQVIIECYDADDQRVYCRNAENACYENLDAGVRRWVITADDGTEIKALRCDVSCGKNAPMDCGGLCK